MRKEIENWHLQSQKDFVAAENALNSGDFFASVFWCQQSVEKGMKSLILLKSKDKFVPEHSLISLSKKIKMPEKFQGFLKKLSPQYFLARYPDASEDVPFELYDKDLTKEFIIKSGEILSWIKKQLI